MSYATQGWLILAALLIQGCYSSNHDAAQFVAITPEATNDVDTQLRGLIVDNELTGDASTGRSLPGIDDPLAKLGMTLFFTKSLGGEFDTACVSCHHPALGGSDGLSLSVGIGAIDPNLLGIGRGDASGVPNVPRNAPTTFNVGLWDGSLFWDSRVESLGREAGQNGAASGISTPDSGPNALDVNAGSDLAVAQARFPVTSVEEMRGELEHGGDNDAIRAHLAARLGDYGAGRGELSGATWLEEFRTAFSSSASAEVLITYDNIAAALGAYERSQVFVDNPWRAYVRGDDSAISDAAKRGAILFFTNADEQGGGCVQCHSGDLFSDEQHHTIAAPQFGPGKGNRNDHDFGRENISGNASDRFRFRTPSLLNVEVTGPYTHTGAYETLRVVVDHHHNPNNSVAAFFAAGGWCSLPQFQTVENCEALYPDAEQNSQLALDKVASERRQGDAAALPNIDLNAAEKDQIVEFLRTLTDPCVTDRRCLDAWIPTEADAADAHQLVAVDENGSEL